MYKREYVITIWALIIDPESIRNTTLLENPKSWSKIQFSVKNNEILNLNFRARN